MFVHEPDYVSQTARYYFRPDEGATYTSLSSSVFLAFCVADKFRDGLSFRVDYHVTGECRLSNLRPCPHWTQREKRRKLGRENPIVAGISLVGGGGNYVVT